MCVLETTKSVFIVRLFSFFRPQDRNMRWLLVHPSGKSPSILILVYLNTAFGAFFYQRHLCEEDEVALAVIPASVNSLSAQSSYLHFFIG